MVNLIVFRPNYDLDFFGHIQAKNSFVLPFVYTKSTIKKNCDLIKLLYGILYSLIFSKCSKLIEH